MIAENRRVKRFSVTLRELMSAQRVSAAALSKAIGIPKSTLSEWLTATREPKLNEAIVKLARFFGVTVEFLITGEELEETFVKDLINSADNFVTIHKGVYRFKVEKYLGPKKRDGESE